MNDQGHEPRRPAGTVYGRGGVDVRHRKEGLFTRLNPLVTLGVLVGVLAVFALGYGVWRANSGASAEASAVPTPPAVSQAPTAEPSATLATGTLDVGSWYLAPADQPTTRLVVDNDNAAWSDSDQMLLVVTAGLADGNCFTFQGEDGRYLRHSNYRLRFDKSDGSDLFRKDATFCKESTDPNAPLRLHSTNYPENWLHRRGSELWIDKSDNSEQFTKDSTFVVVKPQ